MAKYLQAYSGHMDDKTTHKNALLKHWLPGEEEDLLNHRLVGAFLLVESCFFVFCTFSYKKIIMHFLRLQYSIDNTLYGIS